MTWLRLPSLVTFPVEYLLKYPCEHIDCPFLSEYSSSPATCALRSVCWPSARYGAYLSGLFASPPLSGQQRGFSDNESSLPSPLRRHSDPATRCNVLVKITLDEDRFLAAGSKPPNVKAVCAFTHGIVPVLSAVGIRRASQVQCLR